MTSPDGLPLGQYGNAFSPGIGDWEFPELDLIALGDEILFGPIRQLLSAVTGLPIETWPTIPDIIDAAKNFLGAIGSGIEQILRGVIPIGWLSRDTPNLLANGGFDGAASLVEGEGWSWDEVVGRSAAGSARFDASGTAGIQLSLPVQVAEGQKVDASVWVRRDGLTAGSGAGVGAVLRWYAGESLVSTTDVGSLAGGGTHDWARIAVDGVVTPTGVDTVCLALVVDAGVTAGRIWFDDASLIKPATSLPQQWISGLVDALGGLGDDVAAAIAWVKSLIEKLTGRAWSTISDAIGGAQQFADQLKTILGGGSVATPLPSLVGSTIREARTMLEQIAGIAAGDPVTPINGVVQGFKDGWTSTTGWIQDLIDALLRAIRKVPVVGGSLADIIAEVGGLNDRADQAKSAADGVQAGIVEGWAGGSTSGADQDVFDTMSAIKALVGGDGYTRVNVTASGLWTKPAGTTEVIVVGIAAGQNGGAGSVYDGGNGGRGGGHKVQALDPAAFSAIHVEVGSNGAPTRFRANSSGGGLLMEAIVGSIGAMATQFGYAPSNSQAGGGGGGGAGGGSGNEGSSGTGTGGGVDGSATVGGPGGSGGPSAGASGGSTSGGAGGSVSMSGIPSGGGGGGGGKGGSGSIGAGRGGAGGPGGFPGGGGGGGGGKGSGIGGSTGAGGAGGAGFGIIFYR